MSRPLVCGLTLMLLVSLAPAQPPPRRVGPAKAAAPPAARGEDDAPERLLSPTTQLYVRWDGIAAHKAAYQGSIWGPIMAGPTGESVQAILAKVPRLLGSNLLADPLLEGKPPSELRAVHADLKHAAKLVELIADRGVMVAAEVREPRPTLKGIGKALGGLLGSGGGGAADLLMPEAQLLLVVPDVGDRAEVLMAAAKLIERQMPSATDPRTITPLPADAKRQGITFPGYYEGPVKAGCWVEGRHFVVYVGTRGFADVIRDLEKNAAQGGVTGHPLFVRSQTCIPPGGYESVARGFVDAQSVVGLAKRLAGPFVPGLKERLDGLGVGGLQSVVFSSGFEGKESRALYEFELPGERQGFAKVLKPQPLGLGELPPMPTDVSRFSALRLDPTALYDAGLSFIDVAAVSEDFGVEEGAKDLAETIRRRKAYVAREIDKAAGVAVRTDLLPHLGDKFVLYHGPTEGLNVFGAVVCVSCQDPAKVKSAVDRMQRAVETVAGSGQGKVRKKVYRGVEIREFYGRGFGVLTPSYAVVGNWLVIAGHPQPVQGFILRTQGELPMWKPDAATAARLNRMGPDVVGIQFCDPRSTVQNVCCIGPLVIGTLGRFNNNTQGDFNPIDVGLIPNGLELSRHLFPNLTVTRDDGRTVRVEVNESFSLPLEFIGAEPFAFGLLTVIGL